MSQAENQAAQDKYSISTLGRKVFFLYPHSVIRDEMMNNLIMSGFEAYTLHDQRRAAKILERFPGSVMFINIDEGLPEKKWESYIKSIQENPRTKDTQLGILSYNQDKALMEKYLMELNVPCGYIQLKLGIQESIKIMFNVLQAIEAKGQRKYIRAFCETEAHATMNYKSGESLFQGKILNISSAGAAARFSQFPDIPPNSIMREVQLNLKGARVLVDAVYLGKRSDDPSICVMLFNPAKMKPESRQMIHHFIKQNLQKYIDQLIV